MRCIYGTGAAGFAASLSETIEYGIGIAVVGAAAFGGLVAIVRAVEQEVAIRWECARSFHENAVKPPRREPVAALPAAQPAPTLAEQLIKHERRPAVVDGEVLDR
jgi:hypothetical protein